MTECNSAAASRTTHRRGRLETPGLGAGKSDKGQPPKNLQGGRETPPPRAVHNPVAWRDKGA